MKTIAKEKKTKTPDVDEPAEKISFTNPNQGSFLDVHGIPLSFENHAGIVIISAPKTDRVLRLIAEFNANSPVPCLSFISSLQEVKRKIYALRGTGGFGGRP